MQRQSYHKKSVHSGHNTIARKARTRTLIQLGGLLEKSGLMETFGIQPGDDLQKDFDLKESVFTLLGSLLEMKSMMDNEDLHPDLLAQKGAIFFADHETK